jgi:putative phosphoesterase
MMNADTIETSRRVAVIADVHGNAPALAAVLDDIADAGVDLVVSCGDLTWGPLPRETLDVIDGVRTKVRFVRGNAERALGELDARVGAGDREGLTARELWMIGAHSAAHVDSLYGFPEQLVVAIHGLGRVRFCHGSPRSDEELVTPETPEQRMRAIVAEMPDEHVLVTAHTHLQFDRGVCGIRSVNPGSVGMPYERQPGGYWAILGPDVELRRTTYDVGETVRRYRESGDPLGDAMVETLVSPPSPAEVIAHAERAVFSG